MTVAKIWDGAQWVTVQGAQGPPGPQGPAGPSGVAVQPNAPDPLVYPMWVDTDEPDVDTSEAVRLVGTAGEPALAANWSLYAAGWQAIGFYKTTTGVVFLQGMMKKSVAISAGEVLFTLPVGYRPLATCLFNVQSAGALGRVDVGPTGSVVVQAGSNVWLSLAGINFRAEQ